MNMHEYSEEAMSLLRKRDKIDQRLGELFVTAMRASEGVPDEIKEPSEEVESMPKQATPKGSPKPCCGSMGPRHKNTCPQNDKPKKSTATEMLNRLQFDDIKDAMRDRDFTSLSYALDNKLPVREVNVALKSKDYEEYLDLSQI